MQTKKTYVDLTHTIHEGMTTYPRHWHPIVEITQVGRHGVEGRETRKICMGSHTGTHIDAPAHFIEGGKTVDEISLEVLCGPAIMIDFTDLDRNTEISVELMESRFPESFPERVVLRYDWSQYFSTMKFYEDHPYLSSDAAKWLVSKGVKLLAMDSSMPDSSVQHEECSIDSPIHKILLGSDVVLVEYLTNLKEIKAKFFNLYVLPLKIKCGDGAPVRCIAEIEKV
ncbi:MAG: cyclase family protein [bacterium]|nr:cyclase family protein [bacterium]